MRFVPFGQSRWIMWGQPEYTQEFADRKDLANLQEPLDCRLSVDCPAGKDLKVGKDLRLSGPVGVAAEHGQLPVRMRGRRLGQDIAHRLAAEMGQPVVIGDAAFVPAGLAEG